MDSTLFEDSSTIFLVTQVGISEMRTANRMILKFFARRDENLQIVINRYKSSDSLFDEAQIIKALTRPAQLEDSRRLCRRAQNARNRHSHGHGGFRHRAIHPPYGQNSRRPARREERKKRLLQLPALRPRPRPGRHWPMARLALPLRPRVLTALTPRGTSCISCRCRRGRDRCAPPFRRSAAARAGLILRRPARLAAASSRSFLRWNSFSSCVDRRRGLPRRNPDLPRRAIAHQAAARRWPPAEPWARTARPRRRIHRLAVRPKNLHPEQEPHRVFLELQHHRFEHVEGLALVFHQRIPLRIAAQTDALLQVIHREQVILPQPVDHAQHHHPLVIAHRRRAQNLFLGLVGFGQLGKNLLAQLVPAQLPAA